MPDENRPSSMGAALEQAGFGDDAVDTAPDTEALTPDESSTSTPASSDAAQTAASPTETPQSPESTPNAGPIPFDRHKAILDKAYAERDALKAEREALAWAQQVPAGMGPKLLQMAQKVQGNPVEFLMELAAEIQADPTHAASLKSHAARILGQRGTPQNGHSPVQPTVELPIAARSGVPEVDAVLDARDRYLMDTITSVVADVVRQQVEPVSAVTGRIQAAEARQRAEADAQTFATTEFAKVEKLPGFLENREEIAQQFEAEMANIPLEDQDRVAPVVLRDVWAAIALPKLNQQTSQNLLGRLTAKAAAGSLGATPTAGSSPQRPKTMAEALANAGL